MRNKFSFILVFLLLLFSLSSCNEKFELHKYESDIFSLDEAIECLERNGYEIQKNENDLATETEYIIEECRIQDENFWCEQLVDSVFMTAPKRLQKNNGTYYHVGFTVFSNESDANRYLSVQKETSLICNRGIRMGISSNVIVETNCEEVIELLPVEFLTV